MKKIIYSLLAMSVSILILTSCSTTYTQSASNQKEEVKTSQKATITLQENGQNFSEKEVFFKKGDDLLSILKRNFEVKEDNGFITSLEGHSQDEKNQLYWMFTVDGKSATTGANRSFSICLNYKFHKKLLKGEYCHNSVSSVDERRKITWKILKKAECFP